MMEKLLLATVAAVMIAVTSTTGMAESSLPERSTSLVMPLSGEGGDGEGNLQCLISSSRALDSIKNSEDTIKVITTWPATKSGYVHIWLKFNYGDLIFINNVNGRVARLLKGKAAEWAEYWLIATEISGRKVSLVAIEGTSPGVRRAYEFSIRVGERGELSLASPAVLAPRAKY